MNPSKRTFLGPKLTIISINVEGLSASKEELLQDLCREHNCDVLCMQETHRDSNQKRPRIQSMRLVAERSHPQYGSSVFVKPDIKIVSTTITETNDVEVVTVELSDCTVTSVYKPPGKDFVGEELKGFNRNKINFVIGDFNSHSSIWGYPNDDRNGEAVIRWAESNKLALLHDNKQPASFNSCRWRRSYNPDLLFVSERIIPQCVKAICSPIPNTQHRPIMCQVISAVQPQKTRFRRRYNFRKANWTLFQKILEDAVTEITPTPYHYNEFVEAVKKCSRQSIPRGCRTNYVQGLSPETADKLQQYLELFDTDPMGENTIRAGQDLIHSLAENKRERWVKLIEDLDMSRSSHKAWRMLQRLSNDPTHTTQFANVSANQIAKQLMENGKPGHRIPKVETRILRTPEEETATLSSTFTMEELNAAINKCKIRKAAGLDDLRTEQIKHFGPRARQWLLEMFNYCLESGQIPSIWRKAKVIAILKPGKEPSDPKNYRPISLLCHIYKIFERIIHNRLTEAIEPILIPQQAGFRPGKCCTTQALNLTQFIEDGYQKRKVTGAVFIDLTAAYDTINLRMLMRKVYEITKDFKLTNIIRSLLQNRMFYVDFQGNQSRWRNQKNGLPQGSVLAPTLFNIYTNDQPLPTDTNSYIYADDRAIAVQGNNFEDIEQRLTEVLEELNRYYNKNQLRPNPAKTQICAFHLRNKQASRKLQVMWNGILLEHCPNPKYLGVTLDRALTYKQHCRNTKLKVSGRNNILRKISGSSWGASPSVVKTTALALCYSAGEYACPVWYKSVHAKQVDVALNESCRLITGCLKPTPLDRIYHLAGIAPPAVRREAAAYKERLKSSTSERHPLYGLQPACQRLKSRNSFLTATADFQEQTNKSRIDFWEATRDQHWMTPSEDLAAGSEESWEVWKSLNRLRTGTARSRVTLNKWGYPVTSTLCDCGDPQTTPHMYECPLCPTQCTHEELMSALPNAIDVAQYWARHT